MVIIMAKDPQESHCSQASSLSPSPASPGSTAPEAGAVGEPLGWSSGCGNARDGSMRVDDL